MQATITVELLPVTAFELVDEDDDDDDDDESSIKIMFVRSYNG